MIPTRSELISRQVSATTIHGWQTCRLVRYESALYASAARPNPEAKHFWEHEGVFFRRGPDGSWDEVGGLPFNPYTMCVGADGTFWAVAPSSYGDCHVYRTAGPKALTRFEEVHTGTCSYLGAGVGPEGNFLVLYAESGQSTAGDPNGVVAAFHDRTTDRWHRSRIETPEGRYGYEGIILRGRKALVVLNSSLTDPEHSDGKDTKYSWRHVRLARCDDLTKGEWVNRGWLMPQDGKTSLQDLIVGPDGGAYLSYSHVAAPSHEALMEVGRVPHCIARIHDDLSVDVFETGLNASSTRLIVDARGGWHIIGRAGSGNLRLWDLDPEQGFRPGNERQLAGTEKIEDYVIHTLRPERFGGEGDVDTVHLMGTTCAPDPPGKERGDVELWHVSFRLPDR
ncbi:MAG: hypothetical protein EXS64_07810 [Candidatus Latescibacteria bacterium]|nr:hypothetical protein [Candidatus Latescibacterota bacterium]